MRFGKLFAIALFIAFLAILIAPSITHQEQLCEKASQIIAITETPQIKPGEEGKLEFNITNPCPLVMENVSLAAEIYYRVTEGKSCGIDKVENPPKFENSTKTIIHWNKILSNETNVTTLLIISTKDTDQGTYFIRFQLEFNYHDTPYKMKSRGYFTDEEWENATSNASGYPGGVNLSMLGVDGIIPETSFSVKEEKDVPSFEFVFLIIAIASIIFLKRRNQK
jgi:hypothetical protein